MIGGAIFEEGRRLRGGRMLGAVAIDNNSRSCNVHDVIWRNTPVGAGERVASATAIAIATTTATTTTAAAADHCPGACSGADLGE